MRLNNEHISPVDAKNQPNPSKLKVANARSWSVEFTLLHHDFCEQHKT